MRILEALRLRVKDVEFERRELIVRQGKGNKDRVTVLPENLIAPLREQMERARVLHRKDLDADMGAVGCPMRWLSSTRMSPRPGAGGVS
ncbi:hypothetical protein GCM10022279_04490 [Comamonas faecalis]|uniref:Tyr recombinase domain-containing protein n=1 Tax=Comamonas faecalis TaxID=1387849 RepID=A0ABP7QLW2_9BURK